MYMPTKRYNLNDISPRKKTGFDWALRHRTASTGDVTVHFGDIASQVEAFISESDAIVGCVAWVRSPRQVEALSQRPVALVVNKEFSLRQDGHAERKPLLLLKGGVPSKAIPEPVTQNGPLEAVRCAGWAARGRFGAIMHHKFLVRLTRRGRSYIPTAVWTGSFNLTTGAEGNIENGMVLTSPELVQAFLNEFARVWAVSEPLTFTSGAPTPGSKGGVLKVRAKRKKTTVRKRKPVRKK